MAVRYANWKSSLLGVKPRVCQADSGWWEVHVDRDARPVMSVSGPWEG